MPENFRHGLKNSKNVLKSGRLLAAGHDDLAGADRFDDLELREHRDGGIDLGGVSGNEGDHRCRGEIDGFSAEMLDDLERLGALFVAGEEFDEDQFLDHGVLGVVLGAMDDVDELADLHDDLAEAFRITGDADGHAGEIRIAAFGDDEGIDVEGAAREDLANAHEHSGLVIHEDGEGVRRTAGNRGCRNGGVGGDDGLGHGKIWMVDRR